MNNNKIIKKEEKKCPTPARVPKQERKWCRKDIGRNNKQIFSKFDGQVYTLYQQTPNKINMKKSLHWDIISNYEKPKNKEKI